MSSSQRPDAESLLADLLPAEVASLSRRAAGLAQSEEFRTRLRERIIADLKWMATTPEGRRRFVGEVIAFVSKLFGPISEFVAEKIRALGPEYVRSIEAEMRREQEQKAYRERRCLPDPSSLAPYQSADEATEGRRNARARTSVLTVARGDGLAFLPEEAMNPVLWHPERLRAVTAGATPGTRFCDCPFCPDEEEPKNSGGIALFGGSPTASLQVSEFHFRCSDCGAAGDVVDWLSLRGGYTSEQAARLTEGRSARLSVEGSWEAGKLAFDRVRMNPLLANLQAKGAVHLAIVSTHATHRPASAAWGRVEQDANATRNLRAARLTQKLGPTPPGPRRNDEPPPGMSPIVPAVRRPDGPRRAP